MAPPTHDSDATQVRLVLGLSGAATDAELQAAYWALRAHIESRAGASEDHGFIAARAAELQRLTEQLALALDVAPDALPPPDLEPRRPAPAYGWIKGVGVLAAALGVLALFVFLVTHEQPVDSDASPLAAVATPEPTGRLVFDVANESQLPHRYTVLDAQGREVVRSGVTTVGSIELAPGEYSVWLSALACDASRQHSVLIESDAEIGISGPDCLRTLGLVVRSDVTGDRVTIDGQDVGRTGPDVHTLSVGSHEISVQVEGRPPWRAQVEVGDDDQLTLHARLRADSGSAAPEAGIRPTPPIQEPPAAKGPTAPAGARPQPRPELGSGRAPEASPGGVPHGTASGDVSRDGRGGSRSWHDGVRRRLVAKYDTNGSDTLDSTVEIASIPCTEWRAIESQYEAGGLQVPMTRLYGFDGSDWVDGALGIEQGLRDFTYRRMKECGLK